MDKKSPFGCYSYELTKKFVCSARREITEGALEVSRLVGINL